MARLADGHRVPVLDQGVAASVHLAVPEEVKFEFIKHF